MSSSYYSVKWEKARNFKLKPTENPRVPLQRYAEMLEVVKDADPPVISENGYLMHFIDILPRKEYRDLIIQFNNRLDAGLTYSLGEMVQKTVFNFETEIHSRKCISAKYANALSFLNKKLI
jgi:hypothetical protein